MVACFPGHGPYNGRQMVLVTPLQPNKSWRASLLWKIVSPAFLLLFFCHLSSPPRMDGQLEFYDTNDMNAVEHSSATDLEWDLSQLGTNRQGVVA